MSTCEEATIYHQRCQWQEFRKTLMIELSRILSLAGSTWSDCGEEVSFNMICSIKLWIRLEFWFGMISCSHVLCILLHQKFLIILRLRWEIMSGESGIILLWLFGMVIMRSGLGGSNGAGKVAFLMLKRSLLKTCTVMFSKEFFQKYFKKNMQRSTIGKHHLQFLQTPYQVSAQETFISGEFGEEEHR